MRSKEIVDAVEHGQSFVVTRDGREIAELVPSRRRLTFVPAEEFVSRGKGLAHLNPDVFRDDIDRLVDQRMTDPYAR